MRSEGLISYPDNTSNVQSKGGGKIAEFKSQKEDFGPRGHLIDYLPTLRGQWWTFD